ncbi:MAG: ferrochelatase [Bacteroidetes bacterium]|nr:ferrochelatase [Bacteroidota bacterium]MDA1119059.1 ferrochelatase [Bacteroidota bacterium]
MTQKITGVLILNLGTPDSPAVSDVRKYLREFLMDKRVIDIPFVKRWLLVNLIIAPFRAPKSAVEYNKLWVERGSPLKFYGEDVRDSLQRSLGENYKVALGMRYQSPGIQSALDELRQANVSQIIVIPLFPQYASASTGSVVDKVMEITKEWQVIPTIKFINNFVEEDLFIEAWSEIGAKYLEEEYDHFVFSYHGLPERQILKASVDNYCQLGECCASYHSQNQYCYRAQCFLTTKLLTERLGIPKGKYITTFQSRLGKNPWIKPYTDHVLKELVGSGVKRVLAFSPAFVADCLETTVEVGETFKDEFIAAGGEKWVLVDSLNDNPKWIECLKSIVVRDSA